VAIVDIKTVGPPLDPHLPIVALAPIGQPSRGGREDFAGWLTRPVRRSQLQEALRGALGAARVSVGPTPVRATSRLQVLVAEDNPVNQRVIMLFLEKLGHSADVVADGRAALGAIEARQYDVVLMDMQMPEMDGLKASRLIFERRPEGRPRIIAVTANAVAGDRELCLAAGMDDYLSKPFSMDELAHALARG
jgi:CheY-like chemotaxis protein